MVVHALANDCICLHVVACVSCTHNVGPLETTTSHFCTAGTRRIQQQQQQQYAVLLVAHAVQYHILTLIILQICRFYCCVTIAVSN